VKLGVPDFRDRVSRRAEQARGLNEICDPCGLRSPVRTGSVKPIACVADDPITSSAIATVPPIDPGHAPTHSWRGVPLPAVDLRDLAGGLVLPFLSCHPAALMGFKMPFAVLIPRMGGHAT